ncbi:hypothetical protein mRhiFer1_010160 [Rhinolophus ferrumequinum]|uniref:Uncharacterized protein n=1 Tax=Rhinolophus ferrumequinum TaxID=59479 RepID=A0A7J7XQK6_RHIFE|nr:hypothetical protein mRhiFer1_010160 [Rhinolophus ferrumequinum]
MCHFGIRIILSGRQLRSSGCRKNSVLLPLPKAGHKFPFVKVSPFSTRKRKTTLPTGNKDDTEVSLQKQTLTKNNPSLHQFLHIFTFPQFTTPEKPKSPFPFPFYFTIYHTLLKYHISFPA